LFLPCSYYFLFEYRYVKTQTRKSWTFIEPGWEAKKKMALTEVDFRKPSIPFRS